MSVEEPGVRDDFQNVPGLRESLFIFRNAEALAKILPGMQQKEKLFPLEKKNAEVNYEKTIYN